MTRRLVALALCFMATGQAVRVVDGDTFDADLRLWSTVTVHERIRVLGVDTPEKTGATKEAAQAAARFTEAWLARGPFSVQTCHRDSFGRILGSVARSEGTLAEALIAAGHGVAYRR